MNARRGTRVPRELRITIKGLDPGNPFSAPCVTLLVNPQGCAAKSPRPLPVRAAVELEGLPVARKVTARVMNCISLGEHEKFWILGLALDEPGNVWGVDPEPDDWSQPLGAMPVADAPKTVTSTAKNFESASRFLSFLRKPTSR